MPTKKRAHHLAIAALIAYIGFSLPSSLHAGDYSTNQTINQQTAQELASKINYTGSDDSMEMATTNAMRAMNCLASLAIPCAFTNGYRAYGNYTNSEIMDDLEVKTNQLGVSMSSAGAKVEAAAAALKSKASENGSSSNSTSFSRLDPAFLYKGEAAEVAAEFEKRSGMKREEFLQHLSSATDSDLTYSDPDLLRKLESRFEMFTARVPNKEYRENLQKAANMFPNAMRSKVLGELADFYAGMWKDGGGSNKPQTMFADNRSLMGGDSGAKSAEAENKPTGEVAYRSPSSTDQAPIMSSEQMHLYTGLDGEAPLAFKEFIQATGISGDDDSLFKVISKRYRMLTPALIGKANVLDSK